MQDDTEDMEKTPRDESDDEGEDLETEQMMVGTFVVKISLFVIVCRYS